MIEIPEASIITLDTYKRDLHVGEAFDLSENFNGRVGDEQVPLVVKFLERGKTQQFEDGLVPFISGFVGERLNDDNVVNADTGVGVSYTGTRSDIIGMGMVKMNLPGTMFPQEGWFYGFLGLETPDHSKRVSTFNVWFHVYNGNPDMFVNKEPFRTELQKLIDSFTTDIDNTKNDALAVIADYKKKFQDVVDDSTWIMSQLDIIEAKIKSNDIATNSQLKQAVADLSTKLITEISKRPTNQDVIDMIERGFANFDGGQPHAIDDEATLKKTYPNGHNGVFITVDTGHMWMYGPNGEWIDGGVYQSTQVKDGSITAPKLASNATFGFIYPGSTPLRYNTKTKTLLFPPDTNVGYQGGSKYVNVNNTADNIELEVGDRGWIYVDTLTGEPGFSHEPVQNQNTVVIGGKLSEPNIYVNGPYLIDDLEPLSQYAARNFVDIFESGKMPNFDSTTNSLHFVNEYAIVDRTKPIQIVNELGEKEFDFDLTDKSGFILIDRVTGIIQKELSAGSVSSDYVIIGGFRYNGKLKLNGLFTVDGTYYDDLEAAPNYNLYFSSPNKGIIWNTDERTLVLHEAFINFGRRSIHIPDQTLTYEKNGTYYIYWNKNNSELEIEQPPVNVVNSRFQLGWFNTDNKVIYMSTDSKFIKIVPKTQSDYDLSANDNLTFVGDSITYGLHATDSSHSYPSVIAKNTHLTVFNEGVSSATWQNGSNDDSISLVTRSKSIDFTRGNTVVLFAGTNDFAQNLPIGKSDDTTDKTLFGAINNTLKNIYAKNSKADVRLIAPMWRARINDATKFEDIETTTNSLGLYLKDYVDAILEIGNKYHLPVLDLYHKLNINQLNYSAWLADGLHPNDDGYQKLANIIGKFVANS
ncbi:SGNH/GDSL hydrolase family protein [Pediococcus acidilactici]|uniref:SGNH/GDSL hydrolase family protein n=1 Tax=Pediococcus acidilactici TaxID=1254 RepID=UPI001F4EB950|nr:SGNH/GDSL hydrolase family protein [Pediococcus acidilactici]MCH9267552.1 SGNH/GDSL hydrolase family protein [Pediococcus acidilactici]MCK2074524.1 SGNH/GDSL hydrolase family protein [Pediococcus acidilactici]